MPGLGDRRELRKVKCRRCSKEFDNPYPAPVRPGNIEIISLEMCADCNARVAGAVIRHSSAYFIFGQRPEWQHEADDGGGFVGSASPQSRINPCSVPTCDDLGLFWRFMGHRARPFCAPHAVALGRQETANHSLVWELLDA